MTTFEQVKQFEMMLQTTSEVYNDSDKPDTDTILLYLNIAQIRYVKEKYLSQQTSDDNILSVSKRAEEFRGLVKGGEIAVAAMEDTHLTNSKMGALPSDFLFYIKSDTEVTRTTLYPISVATYIPNEVVNYNDIDKVITTPFNYPSILKPVFVFRDFHNTAGFMVIYDRFTTLSKVWITYIRTPKTLVLDVADANTETTTCELASYMHDEITALAVKIFEEYKYKLLQKDKK